MPLWKDSEDKYVSDIVYHADKTKVGSSMLSEFSKDPVAYYYKYVYKDNNGEIGHPSWTKTFDPENDKMVQERVRLDFGSALHQMCLCPGADASNIVMRPAGARIAKFYEDHAGCFIIPEKNAKGEDWELLTTCVNAVKENRLLRKMLENESDNEVPLYFQDPFTGRVTLKVKFDHHKAYSKRGGRYIMDLKTTSTTSLSMFQEKFMSFGYHKQAAQYALGHMHLYGEMPSPSSPGGSGFFYGVIPKNKYCKVFVEELPMAIMEIGLKQFEQQIRCLSEAYTYPNGFIEFFSEKVREPNKLHYLVKTDLSEYEE